VRKAWATIVAAAVGLLVLLAGTATAASLTASVTVAKRAKVTAGGLVMISGTVLCRHASGPATASLEILVDQREGQPDVSESATQVSVPCARTRSKWTAVLGSFTDTPFSPGLANAHASLSACDDVGCVFPDRLDAVVNLRAVRG
jgi:hypothetical protein